MSPTYMFNEGHDFKGIAKHNITFYPIFKDDQQYDSRYCETYAIAVTHGTEAVSTSLMMGRN